MTFFNPGSLVREETERVTRGTRRYRLVRPRRRKA
jgi:hypothetical protein